MALSSDPEKPGAQANAAETQDNGGSMTPTDFERSMKTADQFASEFPWVRYADAPPPTPEEYQRALKRGTELFGHEMREIKTPRDYEEWEDSLIRVLTKRNEEFMKTHDGKTPREVDAPVKREYRLEVKNALTEIDVMVSGRPDQVLELVRVLRSTFGPAPVKLTEMQEGPG